MRPRGSSDLISDRRQRALALLDTGLSMNRVAQQIGCHASSVMRWRDARDERGEAAFEVGSSSGRPPRLSPAQRERLADILLKGAMASGYRTDLWTTQRIADVIQRNFSVRYHRDHIGRLLRQMGWSHQKPERRAVERNEEDIERWKREEWPRIKKKPHGWVLISSSSTSLASS
ncbi:winged helix-turn-helix domain-containing protein [Chloroflexota bacterium]